jgi:hypothetical protein
MKVCVLGWLLKTNPTRDLNSLKKFYLAVTLCRLEIQLSAFKAMEFCP